MKKYKILLWPVSLFVLFSACEDARMDFMVDDTLYLLNPGFQETETFNWGDYSHHLYVIKSGRGQQGTQVEIRVNGSVLTEYNGENSASCKLLPENCYTIPSNRLSFGREDYRASVPVDFNVQAIAALQAQTGDSYALPVELFVLNGSVEGAERERMTALLSPVVKEPYLEMDNPGLFLPRLALSVNSYDEQIVYSKVHTNYFNQWDLSYTLEIDPGILNAYNASNAEKYELLPDGAFEIDPSTWKIPAKRNDQYIRIKINKKNLVLDNGNYLFGNYAIPVRLASVSMHGIHPERSTMLYPVIFQPGELDRTGWEIPEWNSCISEEPQYESLNRILENMLDGNAATYWGSKWDEPKPFPYYFVFDMKEAYTLFRIGITKPNDAWRGNLKAGYIEVSLDRESWTKIYDWSIESNAPREHIFNIPASRAQYIRFVITEAFSYSNPETGAESGAQCDIAELKVWGLK
ncbi:MAG: DUF1735 domain-containing protein [Tannerella sp.]|jgi:hypothetical protein|nr:DUF1735 domain-containing protein [Tannerella sp.]